MMWRSRQPRMRDEALLSTLAERLRTVARSVEPRADFRSSLRTSLMMEASTALVADPSQPSIRPAQTTRVVRRRRLVVATTLVVASLGLGGMASASESALPGDTLYPVKRATERVELSFHRGLEDRGAFQLELAERRLSEAQALSERGPEFADLAAQSVREFEEAAAAGTEDLVAAFRQDHATSSITVLNRFTERTDDVLRSLEAQLPPEATVAVDDARQSLETIVGRSGDLCPSCEGSQAGSPTPADPDGSVETAPEPETEPESPPSEEPPSGPPPSDPSPPSGITSVDSEDDEDSDEDADEDEDTDEDEDADEDTDRPPAPKPPPSPRPTPTPTPTLTPEPTPTLPVISETLEGVGKLLGGALLGGLGDDAD
ncbi:MAG TPA: DUF5667 domain-containing protein [Aeromicrobium sp.]|nr:DUF5667 domain-containing protein [Aeromicrobium sp.]